MDGKTACPAVPLKLKYRLLEASGNHCLSYGSKEVSDTCQEEEEHGSLATRKVLSNEVIGLKKKKQIDNSKETMLYGISVISIGNYFITMIVSFCSSRSLQLDSINFSNK